MYSCERALEECGRYPAGGQVGQLNDKGAIAGRVQIGSEYYQGFVRK